MSECLFDPGTGYGWSILTTGLPTVSAASGCRTGDGPQNPVADYADRGFWFFTRDQVASNATLSQLYAKAEVRPSPAVLGGHLQRIRLVEVPGEVAFWHWLVTMQVYGGSLSI